MQVVIVSGAGSGIGRAAAIRLARKDNALVLCDVNATALAQTADACGGCADLKAIALDVTDGGTVQAALEGARTLHGRIDVIVTAAGIARSGWLTEMSTQEWRRIVEVNLFGTYNFARPGAEIMAAGGGGLFIAIASDAALRGVSAYSAYCASKHAVLGLVRSMALEYGQYGVRANAICPGFVETPMAESLLEKYSAAERQSFQDANPSGRFARPEEIAAAIDHLSSPEASYVNGIAYSIDGGLMAGSYPGKRI